MSAEAQKSGCNRSKFGITIVFPLVNRMKIGTKEAQLENRRYFDGVKIMAENCTVELSVESANIINELLSQLFNFFHNRN